MPRVPPLGKSPRCAAVARGNEGRLVSLIGANGAGKTTTLKAISGVLRAFGGKVAFEGEDITPCVGAARARARHRALPEGRPCSLYDRARDLEMGCYLPQDKAGIEADLKRLFERFPILAERRRPPPARSRAASSRCSPSRAR